MRAPLAFALLPFAILPAYAGETAWQEIAPGVQLRLISSGKIKPDGTTLIGLEIDMPANTKTYWRVPGDTGFPAELDFSGSTGIAGHKVHWPFPQRDETADYLDYVYYGPTVLPVELQLEPGAADLELSTVLGVCSDVCIPAQASFTIPLAGGKPDMANGLRLRQAMAQAPIAWPHGEANFGTLAYDSQGQQLLVPIASEAIDPSTIIVTSASGEPHFGTPQKSREPNLVVVPVLGEGSEIDWKSQSVQLTFMTGMGAFEVTRPVERLLVEQ
jgi:DsbC/DsbD-like thiol-disulfide interchange protein